ncbi:MAG: R3H domain-containing nucleic acid-binding protein [Candidatus Paceibacterota bacterium]|jgi:spoIIIJ-associated protein
MDTSEIRNLIKDLIEKTAGEPREISVIEEKPGNVWISVEVNEPHLFIGRDAEGLHALNHLVHRIVEARNYAKREANPERMGILVDINGFQKKHIDSIRAVAHMMSERARYFKSNIEVDPMTAFERRIVHEFLSEARDLETESIGTGNSRRVVIKYIGELK